MAGFIAGMLLNMTIAVGTCTPSGILSYANNNIIIIIAENTDGYFFSITTPDFVTVFISWLNLDNIIGFDACFFVRKDHNYKFKHYSQYCTIDYLPHCI